MKCSKCKNFELLKNNKGHLRLSGTCKLIKDYNYVLWCNHKGSILPVKPYFTGALYVTRTYYWCNNFIDSNEKQ